MRTEEISFQTPCPACKSTNGWKETMPAGCLFGIFRRCSCGWSKQVSGSFSSKKLAERYTKVSGGCVARFTISCEKQLSTDLCIHTYERVMETRGREGCLRRTTPRLKDPLSRGRPAMVSGLLGAANDEVASRRDHQYFRAHRVPVGDWSSTSGVGR